jgi:hypothetical protein
MESLAVLVATIYVGLILLSLANIVVALLARRGRIKIWYGVALNTITGIVAAWGVTVTLALGIVPLLGLAAGSIILTWPKKKNY